MKSLNWFIWFQGLMGKERFEVTSLFRKTWIIRLAYKGVLVITQVQDTLVSWVSPQITTVVSYRPPPAFFSRIIKKESRPWRWLSFLLWFTRGRDQKGLYHSYWTALLLSQTGHAIYSAWITNFALTVTCMISVCPAHSDCDSCEMGMSNTHLNTLCIHRGIYTALTTQ